VTQIVQQLGVQGPVVQVGAGHGLLAHLLGLQGVEAVGIDRHAACIELAERCADQQSYTGPRPRFIQQTDPRRLPLDNASAQMVVLARVLERDPNPVWLFREAHRVLQPGGAALILAQRRRTIETAPTDPQHPYRLEELISQARATAGWQLLTDPAKDNPQQDIVLVLRRLPDPSDTTADAGNAETAAEDHAASSAR
jgi:ubiquinone/menaquinone biosynthesis C-methylase UbiE